MQAVKDTFFVTVRNRLAESAPDVSIRAIENSREEWLSVVGCFYLRWVEQSSVPQDSGWRALRCEIGWRTTGSEGSAGEDRGRQQTVLEQKIAASLEPGNAELMDHSVSPATSLGGRILWTVTEWGAIEDTPEGVQRSVFVNVLWRESVMEEPRPVSTGVRVFVAPVERETNTPTPFEFAQAGTFDPDSPPAPWIDLGRALKFERSSADASTPVQAGAEGTVVANVRKKLQALVSLEFAEWEKSQLAFATGATNWNVLKGAPVRLKPLSTETELHVEDAASAGFGPGDMVAVDLDYEQQDGYIGLLNPALYISPEQNVRGGTDLCRQVTTNVVRIAEVNGNVLKLERPLVAGIPPAGASAQKVVGFADREAGIYRQEWSALFVEETVCGGRIFYYYPRLQSQPPASERNADLCGGYQRLSLQAHFIALPSVDSNDGASALWYRLYMPPGSGFAWGLR